MDVADECLSHAKDLSGLLLLYSALGDAEGLEKLSTSARENGKNNVAFLSLFLLGKLEECVELLIERYASSTHLSKCVLVKVPSNCDSSLYSDVLLVAWTLAVFLVRYC